MRKVIASIVVLLAVSASQMWASSALGHNNSGTTSIAAGGTALTVTSIPSGNYVMGNVTWNTSGRSLSSCSATSSTCVVVTGCHNTLSAAGATDCFYILSTGATITSITLTPSATTSGNWYISDYSTNAGPMAFDNSCTSLPASSASPVGCTLSLTGSNDVIQQLIACANTCSGAVAGWTNVIYGSGDGAADLQNTASGTGPTWSMSPAGTSIVSGFALKETGGGGASTGSTDKRRKLARLGVIGN